MVGEFNEGAELLESVAAFVRRFVVLTGDQLTIIALWIIHTHAMLAAYATPFLNIHSVEKGSGKSRLLEMLELVTAQAWFTGRVSPAILVRKLDRDSPTLLLDECDAAFKSGDEYAEALRGILNSAHRRGGKVSLCIGQGTKIEARDFSLFCPIAFAGIGLHLPDTLKDRAIPIRLLRKKSGESVSRFRRRLIEPEADGLRKKIEGWATANLKGLRDHEPRLPDELTDRQQDGAEPLLSVADFAGGDWPEKSRAALVRIFGGNDGEDGSKGVLLLRDIKAIFEEWETDRIASSELVEALVSSETSPWSEFNYGKPITKLTLARQLGKGKYQIFPKKLRSGDYIFNGYLKADFEDSWTRYLPALDHVSSSESEHSEQHNKYAGETHISESEQKGSAPTSKSEESSMFMRFVPDVPTPEPNIQRERTNGVTKKQVVL